MSTSLVSPVTLASKNPGKLAELQALADRAGGILRLQLPPRDRDLPDVPEDADTYLGNALAKARAIAAVIGGPTLADDSGLEVDALDGAPGVRSARFGGPGLSDAERCARLLDSLRGARTRTARFRCVLVLWDGSEARSAEGTLDGEIVDAPRGDRGFGYDPIFAVPTAGGRTLAELEPSEKNRLSHRAAAMRALLRQLGGG